MRKIDTGESIAFDFSLKVLLRVFLITVVLKIFGIDSLTQREYVMHFTYSFSEGNMYSITIPQLSIWLLPICSMLISFSARQIFLNFLDLYYLTREEVILFFRSGILMLLIVKAATELVKTGELMLYYQIAIIAIPILYSGASRSFTQNFNVITFNTVSFGLILAFFVPSQGYPLFKTMSLIVGGFFLSFVFSLMVSSLLPFITVCIQKINYTIKICLEPTPHENHTHISED